ncbi:signal peptidase I [Shimazuella sp. AN120528]|uniref:signal peptidase I n=1 Tax=Shimazuella soli TaxID=1892854 RepID=UPI001F0E5AC5|nr:signal peptidase I [Shimazuella soli]MCH5586582.1 signal peptidase I [Shimazuella soli]
MQYVVAKRSIVWGFVFLFVLAIVILVNQFVISLSVVNGTSMRPTLQNGDRLLVNKWDLLFGKPHRGDVITFEDPEEKGRYLVKRVVGVPGDTIEVKNGQLYRNGKLANEPYIDVSIEDGDFAPVKVLSGTVFVMGDNRHRYASRDSRYQSVGLVPYGLISGKVEIILWRPSLSTFL